MGIDHFDNDTDARNYGKAFRAAGFEIEFLDHPSDKDMISALEDTDGYSAIVVVISAHGNENGLVVNHPDNVFMKTSSLDTQKIFEILEMKTALVGKPKIVVL